MDLIPGRTCDLVKPCSLSELTTSAQDRWVQGRANRSKLLQS
jgi:hypothetical protein